MNQIVTKKIETKLGSMVAGICEDKLCLLEFTDPDRLNKTVSKLQKRYKYTTIEGEHILHDQVKQELTKYFEGSLTQFTIPLKMIGTDFEKQVWSELLNIPYGQTRSYLQIAQIVHKPTAFRAVARANGSNNLSIIIPCHRVIASNGNLQGYGGGLWRKDVLLKLERNKIPVNDKSIAQSMSIKKFKLLEKFII